jgi:hypothetical protein
MASPRVTIKAIIEIESQVAETLTNKALVIPHIRVAGCGLNKGDRVKITIERIEPEDGNREPSLR